MLAYTTLGTNDLARASAFYDALLPLLGAKRFMEEETFIAWASSEEGAGLALTHPFDGKPATVGNGVMVALQAGSREQVDAVHAKALELGGSDEGAPGQRLDWFYAGYFRDPDGNKLNVCYMGK
jgi:catechol 2,3-dioxygenase-like lactoylglutathione lyase family enzyme